MSGKFFLCMLANVLIATVSAVKAQQVRMARIGFLNPGSSAAYSTRTEAFRQGLHELGYIEGKNIAVEYKYAEGKIESLPDLAAELIRLKVDVIVVAGSEATVATKKATKEIPVVMANIGDPVARGIIVSLARPGGNITGLTSVATDLSGKRLELLKETIPILIRVGILWNPSDQGAAANFKETESVAQSLAIQIRSLKVQRTNDFDRVFKAAIAGRPHALDILPSGFTNTHRTRIVEFATKHRLPTMFAEAAHVELGGLMSYGPNFPDLYRRAAAYVDKILRGAEPAALPVEQPMKFEFIINLKTAKQIGATIPPNVLVRADKVIR